MTKKKKEEVIEKLKKGEIDVLVGTHSILEENIVFKNLGLVQIVFHYDFLLSCFSNYLIIIALLTVLQRLIFVLPV